MPLLLGFWKNSFFFFLFFKQNGTIFEYTTSEFWGGDAEPAVVPKLPWEGRGIGEGVQPWGSKVGTERQKERMVAGRKYLLSEFVYIWPCLKALIFTFEGKTFSIQTSNSSPPGRQTSSYPLTSSREGQRITPILIGAEVSYFRFLLYHGKIFHIYLQCITDSQNFGKTGRSLLGPFLCKPRPRQKRLSFWPNWRQSQG